MKQIAVAAVAVSAVLVTWSAPTQACGATPSGLAEVRLPFEGFLVPRNVALRAPDLRGNTEGLGPTTLSGPGDVVVKGSWISEGSGARFEFADDDLRAAGLAPGAWQIDVGGRPARCEVTDTIDTMAPVLDLVVRRNRAPLTSSNNCGVGSDQLATTIVEDDGAAADALGIFVVQSPSIAGDVRLTFADGIVDSFNDPANMVTITAVDIAGNVGAPVTISFDEIVDSGPQLGCASVPAAPVSVFASLLLLVRRRRQHGRHRGTRA